MIKNYNDWSRINLNENIQFLTDADEILDFLRQFNIYDYNCSIDFNGIVSDIKYISLEKKDFKYFPVTFGYNIGLFSCSKCKNLESIKGAPKECEAFYCYMCINLKTLEGAPEECEIFYCYDCKNLKSLEGVPKRCEDFSCSGCIMLKSLEGAPEECKRFECRSCDDLKTLEGAPKKCEYFDCSLCKKLKTLKDAPKKCKRFECRSCDDLKTLEGAPKECEYFDCSWCENLEYSLEYFPRCKKVNVDITCFDNLYDAIGNDNFIRLVNTDSKSEFDGILAIGYSRGLDFEEYIKPLLKDKTMTEEAFKHKYRSAITGEWFNF